MAEPIRLPLVEQVEPRLSDSVKDGLASNLLYDKEDIAVYAVKRPGLTSYISGVGNGLGLFGDFSFNFPSIEWSDIEWNGTSFCAISRPNTGVTYPNLSIVSSDFGATWTQGYLPNAGPWYALAWNGTTFCAISNEFSAVTSTFATSTDGITWTERAGPSLGGWSGIASNGNNNDFVVVREVSSLGVFSAYSTNSGVSWTNGNLDSDGWTDVAWNAGASLYCTVSNTQTTKLKTSPTGAVWTNRTIGAGNRQCICSSPTRFFTPANNSDYGHISDDGITWTQVSLPTIRNWTKCCWDGSKFLALATDDGYIAASTDATGTSWFEYALPTYSDGTVYSAMNGRNDYVVALGDGVSANLYGYNNTFTVTQQNLNRYYPYPVN